MGFDAMANVASAPVVIAGGKKKVNRSAKLKQRKLDARREQWLSQVKDKDSKFKIMAASPTSPLPPHHLYSEMRSIEVEREEVGSHGNSDSESPTFTPTGGSMNPSRRGKIGNSSFTESSSGTISDADLEEGDEGETLDSPMDDWEAVADALTGNHSTNSGTSVVKADLPPSSSSSPEEALVVGPDESKPIRGPPRAWRADDVTRPRSLPSLSKHRSFTTVDIERRCGPAHILSSFSSCPICYENLDMTDSSFLPCLCGFRLCLFCHKRILEEDGRCPGCRKRYGPMAGEARLPRSCSMISRS